MLILSCFWRWSRNRLAAAQLVCHELNVHHSHDLRYGDCGAQDGLRWILILSGLFICNDAEVWVSWWRICNAHRGICDGLCQCWISTVVWALLLNSSYVGFGAFNIADSASALLDWVEHFTQSKLSAVNWLTCFEMFQDSTGLGMGAGSYKALLLLTTTISLSHSMTIRTAYFRN